MTGWMAAAVVTLMIRMLLRIHHVIGELPTLVIVGMGVASQTGRTDGPAINAKRVYRIMRQNALLLERKPAVPPSKRAHTGRVAVKESNQRWCSDGFEFWAVITEKTASRSRWTAVTVRHCTGRSLPAASTVKQYRTSCWERWNAASATIRRSSGVADG